MCENDGNFFWILSYIYIIVSTLILIYDYINNNYFINPIQLILENLQRIINSSNYYTISLLYDSLWINKKYINKIHIGDKQIIYTKK